LNRRYESLTEKNDPLVAIAAMVPFESFRPKLHTALIKGELRRSEAERRNSAGRKPWDEVVIFKALVAGSPPRLRTWASSSAAPSVQRRPATSNSASRLGLSTLSAHVRNPCSQMSAVFGACSDLLQAVRHDLHRPHPFGTPMGAETDIGK
jgi:hypothetical protein